MSARRRRDGSEVFDGRLRLADGSLSRSFKLEANGATAAKRALAKLQVEEDATGQVLRAKQARARAAEAAQGESVARWYERFAESRKGTVQNAAAELASWRKRIDPHLKGCAMAAVTRADIERVRNALDDLQRSGVLRPKSVRNIWGQVTVAFKHAASSKDPSLRVRDDDPTRGVLPPDKGKSRLRPFLYPRELETVLACERVALEWRVTFALGAYLYLRPAELLELRARDIDLATAVVHVRRARDWKSGEVKEPKTQAGIRTVPIDPSLLPLAAALLERAKRVDGSPDALLVPIPFWSFRHTAAKEMRAALLEAGVDTARLFDDTRTHEPVDFRSLRDSGITWEFLRGTDAARVQARAGHENMATTLGYRKLAEDLSAGGVGQPFPPLPASLFEVREGATLINYRSNSDQNREIHGGNGWAHSDSNRGPTD